MGSLHLRKVDENIKVGAYYFSPASGSYEQPWARFILSTKYFKCVHLYIL